MSDIKLKKQISALRNTLFEKKDEVKEEKLVPANINSKNNSKGTGIFNDIPSAFENSVPTINDPINQIYVSFYLYLASYH
mgnify:CR=1 FL=1